MSSNPILDDDDILLIPPAEEAADMDTAAPSSISHGSVYPYWTENPNIPPIVGTLVPGHRGALPDLAPRVAQGLELEYARPSRQSMEIQMARGRTRLPPPSDPPAVSFVGAYVFSCVVYWAFCLVLGVVAYVIAVVGENNVYEGNIEKAKSFRRVSFGISGIGVVLGVVFLIVVITVIIPTYGYKKN